MASQIKSFQEMTEAERLDLKKRAASGETLKDLWATLTPQGTAGWNVRAERAAQMLGAISSIADIGCGVMALEQYLPGVRYVPVDCVRRDARTVLVDLNGDALPDCDTEAAALLGVIEYIHDVPKLLREIARSTAVAVVSYNVASDAEDEATIHHTWVNRFNLETIEALFGEAGFIIEERRPVSLGSRQLIWRLRSALPNPR